MSLCGREEENINHLMLFCTKVQDVWTLLFTIFGVNWVLSSSLRETLEGWQGSFARKKVMDGSTYLPFFGFFGGRETRQSLKMQCPQLKG